MKSLANFYAGKTVLVTGHTGFKGSWLALWLRMLGAKVIGFALPPSDDRPGIFQAADVVREVQDISGDVRAPHEVDAVFEKCAPQIVFHLAAQALVRPSYQDPAATYATNVLGTVHVLDAARRCPATRVVVNVTTDKCYANQERRTGYREEDRLGGFDPYSSSKACAELVTASFRDAFYASPGIGLSTARAGNVMGGGDWAVDRLVPDFIRAITRGETIELRSPQAVRPWQFVLEPLHGYLQLANRMWHAPQTFSGAWNFGPDESSHISVRAVAEKLVAGWGAGRVTTAAGNPSLHETNYLSLDCSKAQRELNWRPLLSIDDAIAWTVEWYQVHARLPAAVADFTRRQIANYEQRCVVAARDSARQVA